MTAGTKSTVFKIGYHGKQFELSANHKESGCDLILFIHGLGCSKESFDDAFGVPQFADFQLLAVDLVGYGDSSKPQDFSYSMEDQSAILSSILDAIEYDKIHIVAHSMGGAVGLLLAETMPDKLASFINIEGNLIAEDCGLISRKTTEVSFDEFKTALFDRWRSKGPPPWRELSAKSDALAFYRSCESLVRWSDTEKLLVMFLALNAAKVYIYGDQNADMEILNRLGEIRRIAISGSGHFVMNDNPEEFYARLYEFIGKSPS